MMLSIVSPYFPSVFSLVAVSREMAIVTLSTTLSALSDVSLHGVYLSRNTLVDEDDTLHQFPELVVDPVHPLQDVGVVSIIRDHGVPH